MSASTRRVAAIGWAAALAVSAGLPTPAAASDLHAGLFGDGRDLIVAHNPSDGIRANSDLTADNITIEIVGPNFVITTSGPLRAGPGCTMLNLGREQVQCSPPRYAVQVVAGGGDDVVVVRRRTPRRVVVAPARFLLGGGSGNDRIVGSADDLNSIDGDDVVGKGVPGVVVVHGNDYLEGGQLGDTINGWGGVDTIRAGGGPDSIFSVDGVRDNKIDCGEGIDRLDRDPMDPAIFLGPFRCENVRSKSP